MKIETRAEHRLALGEIERLIGVPTTTAGAWLRVLSQAVEAYELEHFPIGRPEKWLCPFCGAYQPSVLNAAGDDVCCAQCGRPAK